jgi:hypothetical protein
MWLYSSSQDKHQGQDRAREYHSKNRDRGPPGQYRQEILRAYTSRSDGKLLELRNPRLSTASPPEPVGNLRIPGPVQLLEWRFDITRTGAPSTKSIGTLALGLIQMRHLWGGSSGRSTARLPAPSAALRILAADETGWGQEIY